MRRFAIKDLERITGVKAHTIRAWEVRYNVFSPHRTTTNIRYYSIEDVSYLLNLSLLINKGYRISRLANISRQVLEQKILSLNTEEDRNRRSINELLICMYLEDIEQFEVVLDAYVLEWGIDQALQSIVLPFLITADLLSYHSSSSEVHFVVTAVRKKIIRGIESLTAPLESTNRALLFLFKDEHYDLMLLYLNYLLKAKGIGVFYLGTNISPDSLEKVLGDKKPEMLFTYASSKHFHERAYSRVIAELLPRTKLCICHYEEEPLTSDCSNVVFLDLRNDTVQENIAVAYEPQAR